MNRIKNISLSLGFLLGGALGGVLVAQAALTLDGNANSLTSDAAIVVKGAAASEVLVGAPAQTAEVAVGSSSAAVTVSLATGVAGNTVNVANSANTSAQTVAVANGASAANSTVNVLSGAGTAGTATLNLGNNPRVTTVSIGNGAVANALTVNLANAANATSTTVNIASGAVTGGTSVVNIANGASAASTTVSILSGTGSGDNAAVLELGNSPRVTTVKVGAGNPVKGVLTISIGNGTATSTGTVVNIGATGASSTVAINGGTVGAGTTITGGLKQTGGRTTVNTATSTSFSAATTATVPQVLDNRIFTHPFTDNNARTLTLPTAAALVAGLPGTAAVGDTFSFVVSNASSTVTVAGGAGVTMDQNSGGQTTTIVAPATRVFTCQVNAVGGGSESITCY